MTEQAQPISSRLGQILGIAIITTVVSHSIGIGDGVISVGVSVGDGIAGIGASAGLMVGATMIGRMAAGAGHITTITAFSTMVRAIGIVLGVIPITSATIAMTEGTHQSMRLVP